MDWLQKVLGYGTTKLNITLSKNAPKKRQNQENHRNLESGFDSRGKKLSWGKGTFQGDVLSRLRFVIAMMPLNQILRECTAGYKLSKSQEKINVHGWHQTVYQKRKTIENSNTGNDNI